MRYPIVLSILLSFSQAWSQHAATNTFSETSPNGQNVAIYTSISNGSGSICIKSNDKQNIKFKILDHRIPSIDWLTNDLVSINVSCGSPCWYRRYYDVSTGKLSPEYAFAQDSLPSRKLVAHIGSDSVLISEIFSGKVIATYKPTPSECPGFICYSKLKFVDNTNLVVDFGETTKTLRIPK